MEFKDIPWKDVLIDTRDFTVFKDKYPVTEGHILFVPKNKEEVFDNIDNLEHLMAGPKGDILCGKIRFLKRVITR